MSAFSGFKLYLIYFSLLFFIACDSNKKKANEVIENAGKNKIELEKAITHYKESGDKEKLQAVYFLIGNMKNKYGRYGDIIQSYYPVFDSLQILNANKIESDTINKRIKTQWDSIEQKVGPITGDNYQAYYDYQVISADYLIENIDYAFKAWKEKPWAKHLNFNQFCEFILPYRLLDEPLQFYRKEFYNEFSWVEDSVKDKSNPIEVCQIINDYVAKKFNFCSKLDKCPLPGATDMYKLQGGICEHRYLIVGSILRSIGIPICVDFTPQFNNNAIGHSWLATIDKNNQFVPFNGGEPGITISDTLKFPIIGVVGGTKVFRNSFDEKPIEGSEKDYESLIPAFKNRYIQDVSYQYKYAQMSITSDLPENYDKAKQVYICSFGYGLNFMPTYYAKPSSGKVTFKNIGSNCVYFLADIQNENQLTAISNPLYLHNDSITRLNPDLSKKQEVILTRKFLPAEYIFKMYQYASWLKGAKFQASDDRNFSNSVTIYEIDRNDYLSYTEKNITIDKPYRFYRYLSSDTGKIRMSELGFISDLNDNKALSNASVYGHCPNCNNEPVKPVFENAFDNNISTNLNAPVGSWVAVDFKKPIKINKVYFLIRNDLNAVEIGDTYELFYFNMGWISLGKQVADKYYLIYKDVPTNALLLLRDLTKGREERIFIYRDGRQIWL